MVFVKQIPDYVIWLAVGFTAGVIACAFALFIAVVVDLKKSFRPF